jgi:hypothetical protein
VPAGSSDAVVSYTIATPGLILEQGSVVPDGPAFTITYDPVALHNDFPNIDLTAPEEWRAGLSDEVVISLLLVDDAGSCRANVVTLLGEEVVVGRDASPAFHIYLPVVLKS